MNDPSTFFEPILRCVDSSTGPPTNFRPTHNIQGNNTYLHAGEGIPAHGGGHHKGGGGGEAEEEESCDLHACVLVNC